ncbi:MogA/MoaB family molybdenum cofactor biosynthesis protein [Bacillaceae bacterium W0354]
MLKKHREVSPKKVSCAIITVSDTRDFHTDKSGKLIEQLLIESGHFIVGRQIVKDDQQFIQQTLKELLGKDDVDVIILNGGTGIAKRDVTIESVSPFLDKELPGFGELFRYLSYELDIGSASIMSRAIAGVAGNKAIFSIPGSSGAVKLAMEKLIIPEIGHIVMEINKDL